MHHTLKTILTLLTAVALLAGCNTIAGLGKDLQSGGKAIEGAASK